MGNVMANRFTAGWTEVDKEILLFGREVEGRSSTFWNSQQPFTDEDISYVKTKGEFVLWQQGKRAFSAEEVLTNKWIKTNPGGHTTQLYFYPDGTLQDVSLFDGVTLSGHWHLNEGKIAVTIEGQFHHYTFDIVANDDDSIHSAVEFEDGSLSTYLKVFCIR